MPRQKVAEIVRQVREKVGPYSAFDNCTTFSFWFHTFSHRQGYAVRTLTAKCGDSGHKAHAFNAVKLEEKGLWHLIEPDADAAPDEGNILAPGFEDIGKPNPVALCTMMDESLDKEGKCSCYVVDNTTVPMAPNTNPYLACSLNEKFQSRGRGLKTFLDCQRCCHAQVSYYVMNEKALHEVWRTYCIAGCRNQFYPGKHERKRVWSPNSGDSAAAATGRACVYSAKAWWRSRAKEYEQCETCCHNRMLEEHFLPASLSSCMAPCNAEFK